MPKVLEVHGVLKVPENTEGARGTESTRATESNGDSSNIVDTEDRQYQDGVTLLYHSRKKANMKFINRSCYAHEKIKQNQISHQTFVRSEKSPSTLNFF